jgi:hypothetical protein
VPNHREPAEDGFQGSFDMRRRYDQCKQRLEDETRAKEKL